MAKQTEKKPPVLKGVSAAEQALAVLTAFRRGDSALSLAELAKRTGLVKSTIMRLALSPPLAGQTFCQKGNPFAAVVERWFLAYERRTIFIFQRR